jgi:hypothetical protein
LDGEEISFHLVNVATVGVYQRERSESPGGHLVGRPGLDPGTLRVFPERPWTSVNVQICWLAEVACPLTSADVLLRLNSWLDLGPFQGQVTVQYRGVDGEELDLYMGERTKDD